jgi:predicted ATPase
MITKFHIENFKSLVNFDLPPDGKELGGLACLIGLNGSGKSTLLQAFDFIAHVASGKVTDWLERREWKKGDLLSHFGKKTPVISFEISMKNKDGTDIKWSARFNVTSLKCTAETITSGEMTILEVKEGGLNITSIDGLTLERFAKIPFEYEGSVMSTLKFPEAHPDIAVTKVELEHLCSLELLSPQLMRRKARMSYDIGAGGEKLSSFLYQLPADSQKLLFQELSAFYPQLTEWKVKSYLAGWKMLLIGEKYPASSVVEVAHINDGFLRVIAILAQAHSAHQFLLFDEIENGINPALVEKLMDFLVGLEKKGKQVIVTTHSPMILNYLEDDVARQGVFLLYKGNDGKTKACRYFDQPETGYKLNALGPGEVFVDTDLNRLVKRLSGESSSSENRTKEE